MQRMREIKTRRCMKGEKGMEMNIKHLYLRIGILILMISMDGVSEQGIAKFIKTEI